MGPSFSEKTKAVVVAERLRPPCVGFCVTRLQARRISREKRRSADPPDDFKVGIEIDEYRLDEHTGFVPRAALLANPTLAGSTIIKMPNGTVFLFSEYETREFWLLW